MSPAYQAARLAQIKAEVETLGKQLVKQGLNPEEKDLLKLLGETEEQTEIRNQITRLERTASEIRSNRERPAMKLHTGIPDKFVQPEEVTGESLLRFLGARCDHLAGKMQFGRNRRSGESLFAPFGGPAGAIKPLTDDELRRELGEVVADLEKYLPTLRRLAHNQ